MFNHPTSNSPASSSHVSPQNEASATGKVAMVPPSVNFHLTKYCNMKCSFCYATFNDLGNVRHDVERSRQIIQALAEAGFEKLTFAGGEPTLVKELPALAQWARELGLVTTIVTNGANLRNPSYFDALIPHLDWVALSIDSVNDTTNANSGRVLARNQVLTQEAYQELHAKLKAAGMKTKINTVVSAFNHKEDLTEFINHCQPKRWKVLQALPIEGQNSDHAGTFEVTDAEYQAFLSRHGGVLKETKVVAEEIELIKGSYIMVNPKGEFYDNCGTAYRYSESILKVGVHAALKEINFDHRKFVQRGGQYAWK